MSFSNKYIASVYEAVEKRNAGEAEFHLQAVREVLETIEPVIEKRPDLQAAGVVERIVEPERFIKFRVSWVDDSGRCRSTAGSACSSIPPSARIRGGLRLHPSVNASVIKFLGFEQIFKNSLTGLPMGGGGKRRLGLRPPQGQERYGNYAFLPVLYDRAVQAYRRGYRRARGRHRRRRPGDRLHVRPV